ncbi:transcriptional regulator with XRE-family HTH domain [Clostridium punense]|uniref:Transcriptional regulator with XRE-family HTH domain n=2 Tax=root TaxID=1 RepID=A0ABS4K531_9CLOT|nr:MULTISPECIES: helix-turn-helix transcriptional regulator [Clostridium]EQB86005.1 hypothetical protein M918_16515 [Clostridium sp. BL8]MBP2022371.1 transcriptional regulator with XRE-family HTH domain [Clostridium punense]
MAIYLGGKIKALRKEKRLIQKDLCGDLINKSTICKIENDVITPSIEQLTHISRVLQVPISYFFEDNVLSDYSSNYVSTYKNLYQNNENFTIIDKFSEVKIPDFEDYFYVGLSYFNIDEYGESRKFLKQALKLYNSYKIDKKTLYSENYAIALNTLAKIHIKEKAYIKATHYLYKAKTTLEANNLNYTKTYIIVVSNLGSVYCYLEDYEKTIRICEEFLKENLDCTYIRILCSIHLSLNIAYFKTNDIERAIDHIKKAIFFYEYTGNKDIAGRCYVNYINCLRYGKEFDKALKVINENYFRYNENIRTIMILQRAIIYYNLNLYNELYESIKLVNLNKLKHINITDYYFLLGRTHFVKLNYNKSHYYYNKCIPSLLKYRRYADLSIVYKDLSLILDNQEFLLKSKEYLDIYKNITNHSLYTNLTIL